MDRKTVKEVLREEKNRNGIKRRGRIMQLIAMTSCLIVLVVVMYGGLLLYSRFKQEPKETMQDNVSGLTLDDDGNVVDVEDAVNAVSDSVVYSQEELDERIAEAVLEAQTAASTEILEALRMGFSEGGTGTETVLKILRPLYPDDIVIASGGKYHFVPINYDLAQSQLLTEKLNILESGEIQYLEDGQVVSHKGIDVSKFQGTIDWNLVAQDGVEFAFIRVANRGWGSNGTLMEDERFEDNILGAQAAGIKTGVYFYSQAITEEEVLEEANLVLSKIAPYNLECPVVFDVERVSGNDGRMNNITVEERTHLTLLFCQTIEAAGYRPMIYHNTEMGALFLNVADLEGYDKWFAAYTDTLYYPYEYKVWQYSQSGTVRGINTEVDLNICFEPLWETSE